MIDSPAKSMAGKLPPPPPRRLMICARPGCGLPALRPESGHVYCSTMCALKHANMVERSGPGADPETETDKKPVIVCLCGSTRFRKEMAEENRKQTMMGRIVLAPGVFAHDGDPLTLEEKKMLDELHFRKIDMSGKVIVVNPGGYIGESTSREIAYAETSGKPVEFTQVSELNPDFRIPASALVNDAFEKVARSIAAGMKPVPVPEFEQLIKATGETITRHNISIDMIEQCLPTMGKLRDQGIDPEVVLLTAYMNCPPRLDQERCSTASGLDFCKNCGGKPDLVCDDIDGSIKFLAKCEDCSLEGPYREKQWSAVIYWNKMQRGLL